MVVESYRNEPSILDASFELAKILDIGLSELSLHEARLQQWLNSQDGALWDRVDLRRDVDAVLFSRVELIASLTTANLQLGQRLIEQAAKERSDFETLLDLRRDLAEQEYKTRFVLDALKQARQRLIQALAAINERHGVKMNAKRRASTSIPSYAIISLLSRKQRKMVEVLRSNSLFDASYYLQTYPDVRKARVDPLLHFIRFGVQEGRKPHRMFDCLWYLERYPDVKAAGVNPLFHYIEDGAREGRDPHPLFLTDWYLRQHADCAEAVKNPLKHYIEQERRI